MPRRMRAAVRTSRSGAAALMIAPTMKTRGRDEDHQPAAVAVGGLAGEGGAQDRADRDRRDHHALLEAAQVQVVADEQQRAGDDARVVAEEEAAEPGDRGREDDVALRACFAESSTLAGPYTTRGAPKGAPLA